MNKILLVLLLFGNSAHASSCHDLYPNGKPFLVPDSVELCNSFFVTAYSPTMKANIFSSEKIDNVRDNPARVDTFRSDKRVAAKNRAELSDYRNSKYDRGHMAPSADSSSLLQMRDTYLLTNIVPQAKVLNRGAWAKLEEDVRDNSIGTTYILTGAVYSKTAEHIGNGIPVPSIIYKCVWWSEKDTQCFWAKNRNDAAVLPIKLRNINRLTGLKLK